MSSKVYFSRTITAEKVLELYKMLGKELKGRVAIKVHSGEVGNQNFIRPNFWKPMIDQLGGTVVECNIANGQALISLTNKDCCAGLYGCINRAVCQSEVVNIETFCIAKD